MATTANYLCKENKSKIDKFKKYIKADNNKHANGPRKRAASYNGNIINTLMVTTTSICWSQYKQTGPCNLE